MASHGERREALEDARRRLEQSNAHLFDDPGAYRAGVEDAFAVYAVGVAMRHEPHPADDRETVDELVDLASGRAEGLHDARSLLRSIELEPDRSERAALLIERAITRVEESSRLVQQARRQRDDARRGRRERAQQRDAR